MSNMLTTGISFICLYVCMKQKVKKLIPYSANNLAADNNNEELTKAFLHRPQLFNMFVPDLKGA